MPLPKSNVFNRLHPLKKYVIYEMRQKTGSKIAVFCLNFCPFFALKPLHMVVDSPYLPSEPQYVIITTHSTCLEDTKKMPYQSGIPLAGRHVSEAVAWIDHFLSRFGACFCVTIKVIVNNKTFISALFS